MAEGFRTERDPLGDAQVPADAYYGVQTQRAVDNFPVSGLRAPGDLVTATILVKKAAAEANATLGRLKPEIAAVIVSAADEILSGSLRDQFVVDVYQAGAGTSHNMNANEVLANRASHTGESTRTTTSTRGSPPTTSSRPRLGSRCCSVPRRSWRQRTRWRTASDGRPTS